MLRQPLLTAPDASPLWRFIAFYTALFAAFGVASPFIPALLREYGLGSWHLSLVLAAGTAVRLLAGPIGGRIADRTGRSRAVLVCCAAAAAIVAIFYVPARGVVFLLAVSVAHAAVLAPLTPVADALALSASRTPNGFAYGWVRGAGSAAFIGGVLLSGEMVSRTGLGVIVWLNAALLATAGCFALLVPTQPPSDCVRESAHAEDLSALILLRIRPFAYLMLVAALVGGSHALHDGFEVIRWTDAGLSARQSGVLWSLSVVSEVAVFVFLGPTILQRLGPGGAMALSAGAGIVRWGTAAQTAWFPVMALVEPLHGLTFALLHLACMDMITRIVPDRLAATAQAFYGTVAMGVTTAAVTLASGPLYAQFGATSFWFMAALCALALPAVARLHATQN